MLNKETISISLKLFIITAVAALCLAFVNKITSPVIAENQVKTMEASQKEVMPEATIFEEVNLLNSDVNKEGSTCLIESLYKAKKDSEDIGYVVNAVSKSGYGGDIRVMVGIRADLTVNKVKITESSETAGLGLKASEPEFIDQYIGRAGSLNVIKNSPPTTEGSDIAAISGATVTSRAVTDAVNAALALVESESARADETGPDAETIKNVISEETIKQLEEDN